MGAATTGTPLYPGTGYPGEVYPGQGDQPQIEVLYSTDDYTETNPTWNYAHHGHDGSALHNLRSYSVDRGRENELQEIDAGTATITLDNRDRLFDPTVSGALGPMNRWWIRVKFAGETHDRFKGYAERYELSWPDSGRDSEVTVSCADEFKVLNLVRLPTMNPPRDTYADLVAYELPDGYWRCNDEVSTFKAVAEIGGRDMVAYGPGGSHFTTRNSPIVGDRGTAFILGNGLRLETDTLEPGSAGSAANCQEITWGMWFRYDTGSISTRNLVTGPADGTSNPAYSIQLNSSGQIVFNTRNSAGSVVTSTSQALDTNTWYFVVCTITGGSQRIYIDGVQHDSDAFTAPFHADNDATAQLFVGDQSATTQDFSFDEMWMKRLGVSLDRIGAMYEAALERGFAAANVDTRIGDVLDAVGSFAPRSLRSTDTQVVARFMHGQEALSELRTALVTDNRDAMLFMSRSGVVTFLEFDHRTDSPWNTAQMTFDDDGTDSRYLDAHMDRSDSFIANEVFVTRDSGLTKSASDATSRRKYGPRTLSVSTFGVSETPSQNIADALLLKYKLPLNRIPAVVPDMSDANAAAASLSRDLGDRVRVIRRPLGIGSAIDQSPWIQKISERGTPGQPLSLTFGVSPV